MRDGNNSATNSIHGTNNEASAWIEADLGSSKAIGNVQLMDITTSESCVGPWGPPYTNGATVQYSNDNSTWTNVGTVSGATDGAYVTISFGGASARYVRLLMANNWLGLGDFRVFAP
jgi:hypothetical protein